MSGNSVKILEKDRGSREVDQPGRLYTKKTIKGLVQKVCEQTNQMTERVANSFLPIIIKMVHCEDGWNHILEEL